MAMKFRKKPVAIEAVQFTPEVALSLLMNESEPLFGKFSPCGDWHPGRRELHRAWITIDTLEGKMRCDVGDWIIKGVKGEFYPRKPDIFAATYEPVVDVPAPPTRTEEPEPRKPTDEELAPFYEWHHTRHEPGYKEGRKMSETFGVIAKRLRFLEAERERLLDGVK